MYSEMLKQTHFNESLKTLPPLINISADKIEEDFE